MVTVEDVDFITIPTRDIDRARRFYGETLGLRLDRETHAGVEFLAGRTTLGIWAPEPMGDSFAPTPNPVALRVADVAAARGELEAAGVQFSGDTIDTGVCHMAIFADPDGNALMLHRTYAPR